MLDRGRHLWEIASKGAIKGLRALEQLNGYQESRGAEDCSVLGDSRQCVGVLGGGQKQLEMKACWGVARGSSVNSPFRCLTAPAPQSSKQTNRITVPVSHYY